MLYIHMCACNNNSQPQVSKALILLFEHCLNLSLSFRLNRKHTHRHTQSSPQRDHRNVRKTRFWKNAINRGMAFGKWKY